MAAIKNRGTEVRTSVGTGPNAEADVAVRVIRWLGGVEYYRRTSVSPGLADLPVVRMEEFPVADTRPAAMLRRIEFDLIDDDEDQAEYVHFVDAPDDVDDLVW